MNLFEFEKLEGKIGFYYENLYSGEIISHKADLPLVAASVIKLPIMTEAFRQIAQEGVDLMTPFTIESKDRLPSCGVLSYLHDGVTLPLIDLVTLMIIVSDNTATNLLIDYLGMDNINRTMAAVGLRGSKLNRKLFQPELSRLGIQNHVTAKDMGLLLKKLYSRDLISKEADEKMLHILTHQQLNGKMPFYLHGDGIKCAHKTGEDAGITHDVGIVLSNPPFIACFLSNETNVPVFERFIAGTTRALASI